MAGVARLRAHPDVLTIKDVHILSLVPDEFRLIGSEATDEWGCIPFLFETTAVMDGCCVDYSAYVEKNGEVFSMTLVPALCG